MKTIVIKCENLLAKVLWVYLAFAQINLLSIAIKQCKLSNNNGTNVCMLEFTLE